LRRHGPVIAIGRPGEKLPPLGAARAYVDDKLWQAEVTKLAQESRLVVLLLDRTSGVAWEFCRLVELGAHARLVLVMPPVGTNELYRRWDSLCIRVEKRQSLSMSRNVGPNAVLATFGADWSAQIIESKRVRRWAEGTNFRWSAYAKELRRILSVRTPHSVSARKKLDSSEKGSITRKHLSS
jgi:hypothetical protein